MTLPDTRLILVNRRSASPLFAYATEVPWDGVVCRKIARPAFQTQAGESLRSSTDLPAADRAAGARMLLSAEFNGPLAGWLNVQTESRPYGDGVHDDTAAIQAALNDANYGNTGATTYSPVVYLPAGTYKISGTLNFNSVEGTCRARA